MVLFSQNQTCRRYFTTSSFHKTTLFCSNLEFHFLNAMIACTETSTTKLRAPRVSNVIGAGSTGQAALPAGLHSLLSVPWAGGSQRPAKAHSDSELSFVGRKYYLSWQSINILGTALEDAIHTIHNLKAIATPRDPALIAILIFLTKLQITPDCLVKTRHRPTISIFSAL